MKVDPQRWALLADPESYGWKELVRDGKAVWDGIKNSRAQANLHKCKVGDVALIYNTSPDKAIMGTARVTKAAYPDPNAPERVVIDIEPLVALKSPLTMGELRADGILAEMGFVKMPRVAVQPITAQQWERVMARSKTDLGASLGTAPADAGGP